jgi:hypothetical protein
MNILNIIGLIANIIGTIILAFSISGYIKSMRLAIDGHEFFILSYFHPQKPTVQVTGTDVHMNRDEKKYSIFTWIGIIFVISGFTCQLLSHIL